MPFSVRNFIRQFRASVVSRYQQIIQYYRTHPRQRKWTLAALIVSTPPLIFLLVVLIETPSMRTLRTTQNQVASEVYSADSILLGRYYVQDRTEVTYDQISPEVIYALVATEDVRFYEHAGIDYRSLGRVLVKSIFLQDESAGGGSTISQQLAKNLYPRKRYWILSMPVNKLREMITAVRLENIYSKEELLTWYLNTIPFADLTFGIESAAKRFFSCEAKQLQVHEAALLVGMLKATHTYNPRLFPERARERRNVVLQQMVKFNYLDSVRADSLKKLSLGLRYNREPFGRGMAPYFREYIKSELQQWCERHTKQHGEPYNIYTDGLKIYTTLDSRMQRYAELAVAEQMKEVQRQFFAHWGKEKPWRDQENIVIEAMKRAPRYQHLKAKGLSEEEIMNVFDTPVQMRVFTWQGEQDVLMRPIDSVRHHLQYLNAGFLVMEASTGKIKAWVGGIDHDYFQFDHVKESTKRQVGSVFKPIVFTRALEDGISPCEFTPADRPTYVDDEGVSWTPRNTQNDYEVRYSMRGALAYSVNTVAVKMIQRVGVDKTIQLARAMGIQSEMPDVPSIALGSSSISLAEMTAAYSTFANQGKPTKPFGIQSIEDMDGNRWNDFQLPVPAEPVAADESIALMVRMLQSVVHEGTASRLRWKYGVHSDVAGKTGTTQANADGWFMAFTPHLVIGSWVGADDPRIRFRSTELGQGSSTALPVTAAFLKKVNNDPAFEELAKATFPRLSVELQGRLDCDLYELDSALIEKIKVEISQQDSLHQGDTVPRDEFFLEQLYKRKLKIQQRQNTLDSLQALEDLRVEGVD